MALLRLKELLNRRKMNTIVYPSQRVGVFVDVQNLYWSARQMYGQRVNFAKILEKATEGRQLVRAMAYVVSSGAEEEKGFFEALEKAGFEVRSKDLQIFHGGAKKADWDIGLAMDAIRLSEKIDVVVLVSGDGDFIPMLNYVKERGAIARVLAFGRSASSKMEEMADEFVDLDKDVQDYLIYDHKEQKGGANAKRFARGKRNPK